jgi:hypothetical protein
MKTKVHFSSYHAQLFLEWEILQTKVVEKIKAHILYSIIFFKWCGLWDKVEKFCRAGKATYDNKAHVHCMLDA